MLFVVVFVDCGLLDDDCDDVCLSLICLHESMHFYYVMKLLAHLHYDLEKVFANIGSLVFMTLPPWIRIQKFPNNNDLHNKWIKYSISTSLLIIKIHEKAFLKKNRQRIECQTGEISITIFYFQTKLVTITTNSINTCMKNLSKI